MLQGVVDGVYNPHADVSMGTGVRLRRKYKFENEIGGKTGTTQNNSDGWLNWGRCLGGGRRGSDQ